MTDANVADPAALRAVPATGVKNEIDIRFDLDREAGKVRAVHGVGNFAPLQNVAMSTPTGLLGKIRALHIPYSYFHDTPLENPGMDVIDVSRLFPIFTADADDPRNYRFAENDAYLQQVIDAGTQVIFRLGESIEVGKRKFRVKPPADPEKWARICLNIVRHYNEGWADGFHWNIRDWAVWEEPNNPNLWAGEFQEYLRLYAVTAKMFKKHFPALRIGGPQTTTMGIRFLGEFLDFCRSEALPLDFVCYTAYYATPAELLAESRLRRRMLDERGFGAIPLWINEWHAGPNWSSFSDPVGYRRESERIGGVDGAVFTATVLCGLQDCPIERACFYAAVMGGGYGMFDAKHVPTPTYHVLRRFCRLFDRSERRIALETAGGSPDIQALASAAKCGGIDLLIGAYIPERGSVRIALPEHFEVKSLEILDEDGRRFVECEDERYRHDGITLELDKPEGAAAFFVELIPVSIG